MFLALCMDNFILPGQGAQMLRQCYFASWFLWFTCNYQALNISTALWFPFNTLSTLYLNLKGREWMSLLLACRGLYNLYHELT